MIERDELPSAWRVTTRTLRLIRIARSELPLMHVGMARSTSGILKAILLRLTIIPRDNFMAFLTRNTQVFSFEREARLCVIEAKLLPRLHRVTTFAAASRNLFRELSFMLVAVAGRASEIIPPKSNRCLSTDHGIIVTLRTRYCEMRAF